MAVEALYRKFETAVEHKSGVSKLQLLYDEITQEELTRQQRKEQKKLKKRKKKERQAVEIKCKVCCTSSKINHNMLSKTLDPFKKKIILSE